MDVSTLIIYTHFMYVLIIFYSLLLRSHVIILLMFIICCLDDTIPGVKGVNTVLYICIYLYVYMQHRTLNEQNTDLEKNKKVF